MESVDPHLRECLRLFLSVDIVGSTAFKSRSRGEVEGWLRVFYEFHREVRIRLRNIYEREHIDELPLPRIWKSLGDEIIFVVEITAREETIHHVNHFKQAVSSYRRILHSIDPKLDLKASAWIAGFPVCNSVVFVARDTEGTEQVADYVGPSIDIGFRISSIATPRRMTLSIELAYLLSAGREGEAEPLLYFSPGVAHKGVLGGRPYPLIWTNMFPPDSDELEILEDRLLGKLPQACNPPELAHFCSEFINTLGRPLFRPFIDGDSEFGDRPPDYQAQLEKTRRIWKVIYDIDDAEEPEATGTPADMDTLARMIESELG